MGVSVFSLAVSLTY